MLGQAISWSQAIQTGQYRHGQATTGERGYDAAHIESCLRMVAVEYARWDMFFARNGLEPLRLFYEDVGADPQACVDRVAALMNIEPHPVAWTAVTVRVQRDGVSDEWRRRFIADRGDPNRLDRI